MNIRKRLGVGLVALGLFGGLAGVTAPVATAAPAAHELVTRPIVHEKLVSSPASVEVSIPVPGLKDLAASIAAMPATTDQFETGYYCSGPIAVPGTYGTIEHCATFAISKNSAGTIVETPDHCRLTNNTGKNVNWYREAWTHWDGYIFTQTAYGTTTPGPWTKYCGTALSFWRVQNEGSYVRASVQAAGSTQTAGANAYAP